MSFTFNWPRFSDQFHFDAIQMLNTALNKGNKPPIIADKIEVVELEMGTQPPELEIRDIGDLTVDQFRGIFRLTYSGDAHLVLKTKVQANPLNHKQPDIHLMAGSRGMLAAKQPLVVPMLLRLSHFKLNSYVVLVVSKQKGITLVFKTDPLQNVDINSTFDSIAVIQKFIQREIEGQLRQMFREDLPGIIHRLSQQWVKAKVEAPYLEKRPPPVTRHTFGTELSPDVSLRGMSTLNVGLQPHLIRRQSYGSPMRPRSASGISNASIGRQSVSTAAKSAPTPPPIHVPNDSVSFPDLENFDPTYGLRPEGLPTKSVFRGFSSLFTPNKGLADLAEEPSETDDNEDDEAASFDIVNWDYTVPDATSSTSLYDESLSEYETIPAVGGGTVTRPRIYHSQSLIQPPSVGPITTSRSMSSLPRPASTSFIPPRSGLATPGLLSHRSNGMYNPYFSEFATTHASASLDSTNAIKAHSTFSEPHTAPSHTSNHRLPRRPATPDSLETQPSRSSSGRAHMVTTPPIDPTHDDEAAIYMRCAPSERRPSTSSSNLDTAFLSGSPPNSHHPHHTMDPDPKIVLRPSLNNSIHQLSTLSHSNHTLSPYTRSLQHFTVRSVPPRCAGPSGLSAALERQPVKAKRKRTHRLGGRGEGSKAQDASSVPGPGTTNPTPPSEFDASDMDRYFRSHDDLIPPHSPSSSLFPEHDYEPHVHQRPPRINHNPHYQHLHHQHNPYFPA